MKVLKVGKDWAGHDGAKTYPVQRPNFCDVYKTQSGVVRSALSQGRTADDIAFLYVYQGNDGWRGDMVFTDDTTCNKFSV